MSICVKKKTNYDLRGVKQRSDIGQFPGKNVRHTDANDTAIQRKYWFNLLKVCLFILLSVFL